MIESDLGFKGTSAMSTNSNLNNSMNPTSQSVLSKLRKRHESPPHMLRPPRGPPPSYFVPDNSNNSDDYPSRPQVGSSEEQLSYTEFTGGDDENYYAQFRYEPSTNYNSSNASFDKRGASLSGYLEEEKKTNGSMMTSSTTTGIFRRRMKVSSIDVASVGNASDTAVSVTSSQYMSGREIHEKAKLFFNAGDYTRALPMFESILSAQVRRFSPVHPSVGAAMHNVGVSSGHHIFQFPRVDMLF